MARKTQSNTASDKTLVTVTTKYAYGDNEGETPLLDDRLKDFKQAFRKAEKCWSRHTHNAAKGVWNVGLLLYNIKVSGISNKMFERLVQEHFKISPKTAWNYRRVVDAWDSADEIPDGLVGRELYQKAREVVNTREGKEAKPRKTNTPDMTLKLVNRFNGRIETAQLPRTREARIKLFNELQASKQHIERLMEMLDSNAKAKAKAA